MERIPLTSPDSELVEASHVRLKHAKELLDVDPTQFMYSGEVSRLQTISSSCWGSWYSTNSKGDAEKNRNDLILPHINICLLVKTFYGALLQIIPPYNCRTGENRSPGIEGIKATSRI